MRKNNIVLLFCGMIIPIIYLSISKLLYYFSMDMGSLLTFFNYESSPYVKLITAPISIIITLFLVHKTLKRVEIDFETKKWFIILLIAGVLISILSYFSGTDFNTIGWIAPGNPDPNNMEYWDLQFEKSAKIHYGNEQLMFLFEYGLVLITILYYSFRKFKRE